MLIILICVDELIILLTSQSSWSQFEIQLLDYSTHLYVYDRDPHICQELLVTVKDPNFDQCLLHTVHHCQKLQILYRLCTWSDCACVAWSCLIGTVKQVGSLYICMEFIRWFKETRVVWPSQIGNKILLNE